jgi:hypothetical protein
MYCYVSALLCFVLFCFFGRLIVLYPGSWRPSFQTVYSTLYLDIRHMWRCVLSFFWHFRLLSVYTGMTIQGGLGEGLILLNSSTFYYSKSLMMYVVVNSPIARINSCWLRK